MAHQILILANEHQYKGKALVGLTGIRVQQRLSQPTLCELYFRAPPGPLSTAKQLEVGTRIEVRLQAFEQPLFLGDVTAIEYEYGPENVQQIYVRGYDSLHRLRKRQSIRILEKKTLAALVREVAQEIGVEAVVPQEAVGWKRIYQHQEDDLTLLANLAAQYGYYLVLRDQALHLITLEGMGKAFPLILGQELLQVKIEENQNDAVDEITTTGWDTTNLQIHTGAVKNGRSGRRTKVDLSNKNRRNKRSVFLVNENTPTAEHAQALAQADLDYRTANEVTLEGQANGHTAYQPGTRIQVSGVDPRYVGQYVLTEVTHTLEASAGTTHYLVNLSTLPPSPVERLTADVATFGEVSQINDPDNMGRVRVKLPTYNDVETDWMNVVMPGAGPRKGFVMLPDKGDKVLVILTRGNPGYGIVVGGMFGAGNLPDNGIDLGGGVSRQSWYSPGGQMIQLDDRGNKIRLQNDSGSFIELDGGHITMAANRIDFRRINVGKQFLDEIGDLAAQEESARASLSEELQRQSDKNGRVIVLLIGILVLLILGLFVFFLIRSLVTGGL